MLCREGGIEVKVFASMWGNELGWGDAVSWARENGFDGIEGPPPLETVDLGGLEYIAEVVTGGGYVAEAGLGVGRHLEDFERGVALAVEAGAGKVTTMAGSDAWGIDEAADFFSRLLAIADGAGVSVSVETHRSRPTFSPWATVRLLEAVPEMKLTCDFSHWCVVCERLVLDGEGLLLREVARRAAHVHLRVGYAQGPQVPEPRDAAFVEELAAHERWWAVLCEAGVRTATPEFGPDGYHQRGAAASLRDLNVWMARRVRSW